MKKVLSAFLAIVLLLTLCACGDEEKDPALGVYHGVSAEMFGIVSDMSEIYSGENAIELKADGKCTVTLEGDSMPAKYTLDGEKLDIVIEDIHSPGTLKDGVLTMDFMEMGMYLIFAKDGAKVPEVTDTAEGEQGEEETQNTDPNLIVHDGSEARYLESKIMKDANGEDAIAVWFDFARKGSEANSFGWSYFYIVTQGGQELESTTILREDNSYLSETEYEDVEPGDHLDVCLTYTLIDTTTPVVLTFTDIFDKVLGEITVDLSEVEIVVPETVSAAGFYTLYSLEEDGETIDLETLQAIGMDQTCFVVFEEDGSGRICFDGVESDLTYDETTIYPADGSPNDYTLDGEYLTIVLDDIVLVFAISDAEPPAPGTVQPAGSEDTVPFPADLVEQFSGDWHGMAVIYEATGDYESSLDMELEIIARFVFDDDGYCTPYIAAALTADSNGNFTDLGASYNEFSDGMMLSGLFLDKELQSHSNAYIYDGNLYIDVFIDDGEGNYLNLYACLKPLDAAWDASIDYPCLPDGAVEFYQGKSFEEIVALFGLDPADLP